MGENNLRVAVTNIGGIAETEVELEPGVTVLEGRNATNRTSFFQALMAAYGSDRASLKGDADAGSVELVVGDETYARTLERENGGVTFDGDPYLDDPTVANLFAFLLETNEARLAVPRGDDLRDIIMRPVDVEAIQAEIERIESEKRRVSGELEEIQSLAERLPALEERRLEYEERIEETEAELEAKEQEIEELDRDVEETQQERSELDDTLGHLRDARADLEDLQFRLETEQESLSSLEDERSELEAQLEDISVASGDRLERIDAELDQLQTQRQSLESEVNTLQRVIQFNEEMLDGATADIARTLQTDGGAAGSVTDRLVDDERVVCWTCGSAVEKSRIQGTIDKLRDLHTEKYDEIRSIEERIEELQPEKQSIESRRQRRAELSDRRDEIEDELREREEAIADLRERIEEQTEEIERLESQAEELEEAKYSDVIETHKEANQLEFELNRLRSERESVAEEIRSIEERLEEEEELERERERLQAELTDLRTKIERLEGEAVEEFNDHMDSMLAILDYSNIERIWLERTQREAREGRRTVTRSEFDLHIVRSTDSGVSYEDTVDHLSESEREVTGLIFALAGYLTHEVYESLPIILLDSLEAIDSDRIANLVEYFERYVDYLVVALLPEDARALDDDYARITDI